MAGIFKAYDIRGTVPDQLDETMVRRIGLAFRTILRQDDLAAGPQVVVGRDMRSHSERLERALIEGLTASGLDVIDIGLSTTPMSYFAVGSLGAAGGLQVTASHNPAEYNGLKMSRRGAAPVAGDDGIPLLERTVEAGTARPAATPGTVSTADVFDAYAANVLSYLEEGERLKVVFDAANGMGTVYLPILERMGIGVVPLYFELDGTFPNHEANPLKAENLEDLCRKVKEVGAHFGVSFDGDADRSAFVDERGLPIGSDLITALIAGELLGHDPGRAVLYDLRSSRAVGEYIEEKGGIPVRERVGHTFMKATLRARDGIFGGELAGHYYFEGNYSADCAILAVVEILNLVRRRKLPLSEIVAPLERYAKSPEINFQVEDKQGKIEMLAERYSDGEIDSLDGITVQYDDWWFNVRPSNTEPYLRLVLEAKDDEALAERRAELEGLLGTPV